MPTHLFHTELSDLSFIDCFLILVFSFKLPYYSVSSLLIFNSFFKFISFLFYLPHLLAVFILCPATVKPIRLSDDHKGSPKDKINQNKVPILRLSIIFFLKFPFHDISFKFPPGGTNVQSCVYIFSIYTYEAVFLRKVEKQKEKLSETRRRSLLWPPVNDAILDFPLPRKPPWRRFTGDHARLHRHQPFSNNYNRCAVT